MSIPSTEERIKQMFDRYSETHTCKCPHCGYDISEEPEDMQDHITYHGCEDGKIEHSCPSCDKDFWVNEIVDRTWETSKIEFVPCIMEGCDNRSMEQDEDEEPEQCYEHYKGIEIHS